MATPYGLPLPHPTRPNVALPAGATDCHAHVFGPYDLCPPRVNSGVVPPELPGEAYLSLLDSIGFARGVLVQHRIFGTDCSAMLRAIALAPARLRGVAVVDHRISNTALARLHAGGIRGARFSTNSVGFSVGAPHPNLLKDLAPRLAQLGWHAQILARLDEIVEIVPRLAGSGVDIVVENFGMISPSLGVEQAGFRAFLKLLRRGGIWLKLLAHRVSHCFPNYADVEPFHRAALNENREQLLWGTDWPHLRMGPQMPDDGHLVDTFQSWTQDAALRQQILVTNPARLYAFEAE